MNTVHFVNSYIYHSILKLLEVYTSPAYIALFVGTESKKGEKEK